MKNKVFVVPSDEVLTDAAWKLFFTHENNRPIGPSCPVGHLCWFLEMQETQGRFFSATAQALGISGADLWHLSVRTEPDALRGKSRREEFIAWLREHFPNQEVK